MSHRDRDPGLCLSALSLVIIHCPFPPLPQSLLLCLLKFYRKHCDCSTSYWRQVNKTPDVPVVFVNTAFLSAPVFISRNLHWGSFSSHPFPLSLEKSRWPKYPSSHLFVFLDFLPIWGQLILVRNKCPLLFPLCVYLDEKNQLLCSI